MEEETWKRLKWEFPVIYLAVVGSNAANYAFTNPNLLKNLNSQSKYQRE